jgi:hypothetical protein
VTVLGVYAVALRPLGVALAPALLLFTLMRYKQHGLRPLAPLGIWGLGLVAVAFITNVAATAVVNLHPRAFYQWIVVEKLSIHNIFAYGNDMVVSHLYPFPWDRANDAFHALTVALMIVGLTAWVAKNHRNFAFLFALSYGLMLVIMPIQQPRYLWPLYPVFVFGMLNGARIFVAFLTKRPQLAASGTLAFAIALVPPAGWNVVNDPRPVDLADLPDVSELIHYLEQRPDADHLRVTFFKPRTLGWTTGIPTMGPPRGQPHCILGELGAREITHVIIGSVYSGQNSHLRETIRVSPERFSKQFENSTFSVYAFRRGNDALTYQQNPECQRP